MDLISMPVYLKQSDQGIHACIVNQRSDGMGKEIALFI